MNGFDVLEGLKVFLVWILRRTVDISSRRSTAAVRDSRRTRATYALAILFQSLLAMPLWDRAFPDSFGSRDTRCRRLRPS